MTKSLNEISRAVHSGLPVTIEWSELREHFLESEDAIRLGGMITWARSNGFEYSISDLTVGEEPPWRGSVTFFPRRRR